MTCSSRAQHKRESRRVPCSQPAAAGPLLSASTTATRNCRAAAPAPASHGESDSAVQLDRPGPALCGASCLFVLHILQRGRLAGRGRAGEDHIDIDPWIGWAMHIALSNSRGVGCAALLVPHFTYQQPKGPGARGKGVFVLR
jgi:hypothetical protein